MSCGINVELTTDLTKYHPNLISGTKGITIGEYGMYSRGSDRFIGVNFPNIKIMDVLWDSLKIIDNKYLEEIEPETAFDIKLVTGPKGGFKYLSYTYKSKNGIGIGVHCSNHDKNDANNVIEILKTYNKEIKEFVSNSSGNITEKYTNPETSIIKLIEQYCKTKKDFDAIENKIKKIF